MFVEYLLRKVERPGHRGQSRKNACLRNGFLDVLFGCPGLKRVAYSLAEYRVHLCTLRDFTALCDVLGARVETTVLLGMNGSADTKNGPPGWWGNATAEQAIFLLRSR